MINILFKDYEETKHLYHIVSLDDLRKTLQYGIHYNDKKTYNSRYAGFHKLFDDFKPYNIPKWVERSKAIFASMNYKDNHSWHSHTALLKIKINEDKCWICNENIANTLYEPFVLQNLSPIASEFSSAKQFLKKNGGAIANEYWKHSLSFRDNLIERVDKVYGYDAEVLVHHSILPADIECLYIVSDHRRMTVQEWEAYFENEVIQFEKC